MKVTPCCKTKHYHSIVTPKDNWSGSVIVCNLCEKEFPRYELLEVTKGMNPVTYFCDNCHKSLEEEFNKSCPVSEDKSNEL